MLPKVFSLILQCLYLFIYEEFGYVIKSKVIVNHIVYNFYERLSSKIPLRVLLNHSSLGNLMKLFSSKIWNFFPNLMGFYGLAAAPMGF